MARGRQCAEPCLGLLIVEMARHYSRQKVGPPGPAAMEAIGLRVGRQLVERYIKDKNRYLEHLELMKFICKDFWSEVFHKQVDNLRTNHRGTYVMRDNNFRWLHALSANPGASPSTVEAAREHLIFPCALIRGALVHLGIDAVVSADPSNLPAVDFTVNTNPSR